MSDPPSLIKDDGRQPAMPPGKTNGHDFSGAATIFSHNPYYTLYVDMYTMHMLSSTNSK